MLVRVQPLPPMRKESAVENEFVPDKLAIRAAQFGFNAIPLARSYDYCGNTLEQLERWIWEKYPKLFPNIVRRVGFHFDPFFEVQVSGISEAFEDPFTARLAGVERVIEILEKRVGLTSE